MQNAHDVQNRVQAYEVGEGKRANRVVHSQLHDAVDGLGLGDPLLESQDGLVDHRAQDPVADEARGVHARQRGLSHTLRGGDHLSGDLRRGLAAVDDLNQPHDRDGIHEVHPDDPIWPAGVAGDLVDGDARGVACEYRIGLAYRVQIGEGGEFQVGDLRYRLYDEVAIGQIAQTHGRLNEPEGIFGLLARDPLLGGHPVERVLLDVDHGDSEATASGHLGDAVAHLPRSHHSDGLDCHVPPGAESDMRFGMAGRSTHPPAGFLPQQC